MSASLKLGVSPGAWALLKVRGSCLLLPSADTCLREQLSSCSCGEARWALSAGLLQVAVVWGTEQVGRGGEAAVLAKARTNVHVQACEFAFSEETR